MASIIAVWAVLWVLVAGAVAGAGLRRGRPLWAAAWLVSIGAFLAAQEDPLLILQMASTGPTAGSRDGVLGLVDPHTRGHMYGAAILALAGTGLTDASGRPLHFTPHDFRRIFITDAIMSGLPPHIAQVIAGHQDINVTLGYKAVYPDEAIQAHLAFLARRRALRPTHEYRTPTDAEWQEFLGHFERRKVATGLCGRAFGTPCIHEHSCLRCALHWPDPAQRPRIAEIRDNLLARIAEAEREGWAGEVEGLKISLAGAQDKLAQIDRRSHHTTDLGMPATARKP